MTAWRNFLGRRLGNLFWVMALGLLLTACGDDGGSSNRAASGAEGTTSCTRPDDLEQTQLTFIQEWLPWAAYAPEWAALENGHYADEGLDVEIIAPADGSDPVRLVATGKAEFGISNQLNVIDAVEEDIPIISVGATLRQLTEGLFFKPDADIDAPEDLRGKTLGVNPFPNALAFTKTLLASGGLTEEDVKIVDPGFSANQLVLSDRVAAGYGFPYYEGTLYRMQTGEEPGWLMWTDYGVPNVYQQVLIANPGWLAENPCTARAFLRATARGLDDFLEDPEKITPVMAERNEIVPLDAQNQMAHDVASNWTDDVSEAHGTFFQDTMKWELGQQYLLENDLIETEGDLESYFTNEYLEPSGG
jgi:putative hydroxymethylpyrimidine transport system substrate-binding protein